MKYLLLLGALALLLCGQSLAQTVITPAATIAFAPGATIANGQVALFTLVPGQAETINGNGNGVRIGTSIRLEITSSGTTSYLVTFNANFSGLASLQTGTTTGVIWVADFMYDGTNFCLLRLQRQNSPTVTIPYVVTTSVLPYSTSPTIYLFTPTAAVALNADNVGPPGVGFTILCLSDGTGRTITFGTNFKTTATLATSGAAGVIIPITFQSNGVSWVEINRGTAESS